MILKNGNKVLYDTIFEIDNYKKAYIRSRMRNGYIQNHGSIPVLLKKQFAQKSSILSKLIKRIVLKEFETVEEYSMITKSCALIEGDLVFLLTKCSRKNFVIKKDKRFKKFYTENQFMFDSFVGKSTSMLFAQNHPAITFIFFLAGPVLPILLIFSTIENELMKLIVQMIIIVTYVTVSIKLVANQEKISCISRAIKTRNQNTFLNSDKSQKMDEFISEIIKTNSRIG